MGSAPLLTPLGAFVGVGNVAASISNLDTLLASLTPADALTFVMEEGSGELVFTSILGATGTWDSEDPQWTFLRFTALESSNNLIRESTTHILTTGLGEKLASSTSSSSSSSPSSNPQLWRDHWLYVERVASIGGIPLEAPWLVVFLQLAGCDQGYYANPQRLICDRCAAPTDSPGGSVTACEQCTPGHYYYYYADDEGGGDHGGSGACRECPFMSECLGGDWRPYPRAGFWTPMGEENTDAMPCPGGRRNCPGGDTPAARHGETYFN
jgi:hypothetical protein